MDGLLIIPGALIIFLLFLGIFQPDVKDMGQYTMFLMISLLLSVILTGEIDKKK